MLSLVALVTRIRRIIEVNPPIISINKAKRPKLRFLSHFWHTFNIKKSQIFT